MLLLLFPVLFLAWHFASIAMTVSFIWRVVVFLLLTGTPGGWALPPDYSTGEYHEYGGYGPALTALFYGPTAQLPIPPPQPTQLRSDCPSNSQCVINQQCIVQCPPGWSSLGTSYCFLVSRAEAVTGGQTWSQTSAFCDQLYDSDGVSLLLLENRSQLTALLSHIENGDGRGVGTVWTSARWLSSSASWTWQASGGAVDFTALGVGQVPPPSTIPSPGLSAEDACLVLDTAAGVLRARNCSEPLSSRALRVCQLSASVARCANDRRCCAVSVSSFPERPGCFIDDAGTRCEQRVREGYFPLDSDNLVRISSGPQPWNAARTACQRDGGDLAVVTSQKFNDQLATLLRWNLMASRAANRQFYIGLRSDSNGIFSHVNGSLVENGFRNFASVADATRPNACTYYSTAGRGIAWLTDGVCDEPRHFVCHIGPVRRYLSTPASAPECGRRNVRGVLGRSGVDEEIVDSLGARTTLPDYYQPVLHPPFLPAAPHFVYKHDNRQQLSFSDSNTQFGEISWQAAVWIRSQQTGVHQFECGGALVSESWVLTSAACVRNADATNITVTLGEWKLNSDGGGAQEPASLLPVLDRQVTQIRISPEPQLRLTPYGTRPVADGGGVALLRLTNTQPLPPSGQRPHISPACLPDPRTLSHVHHLHCVVTGWSTALRYPQPHSSNILQKLDVVVSDDNDCQHRAFLRDEALIRHRRRQQQQQYGPPFTAGYHYSHHHETSLYGAIRPHIGPRAENSDELTVEEDEARFSGPHTGVYPLPPHQPPYGSFYGTDPYQRPPSPAAARRVCSLDDRCISDKGAVLACTLPPPPPPYQRPYLVQAYHHPPVPHRAVIPKSGGKNINEEDGDKPEPISEEEQANEDEQNEDGDDAVRKGTYVLKKIFDFSAKVKRDLAAAEQKTTTTPPTTAANEGDREQIPTTDKSDVEARSTQESSDTERTERKAGGKFVHPQHHTLFHRPQHLPHHVIDQHISTSTEDYDSYFVVGVVSPGEGACHSGPMIFDNILSQLPFISDIVNQ